MLKVKKFNTNVHPGYYGSIHKTEYIIEGDKPENNVFKHIFSSTGNVINYQLISVQDNKKVVDFNIDLDIIKSSPSFDEQTLWAIDDNFVEQNKYLDNVSVPANVFKNTFAQTVVGKTSIQATEYEMGLLPIKIFVPSNTSSVEDIYILVTEPSDVLPDFITKWEIPFVSEIEGTTDISTITDLASDRSVLVDAITISPSIQSPTAGQDIVVTVTVADSSVQYVYVQPIVGIVNKTKIKLTNGVGTVTIKTDTLDSGDEVDIKFGYRYFTNVVRYTKTLG